MTDGIRRVILKDFIRKHIDRALSVATTPGQSEPGNNSNEGMLCIPKSSSITGNLTIRLFSVISWTLVGREVSYPSAEKRSVYSTVPTPADWTKEMFSYGLRNIDPPVLAD